MSLLDNTDYSIDELVNKFLTWNLPDSVCSDLCVTDYKWHEKHSYPRSGTNLLTAAEARQMFEYLFPELKEQ